MSETFRRCSVTLLCLLFLVALQSVVIGQETPAIVVVKDLPRIVPTSFYFLGQRGPTH
ncbi:MAG: hypothetical protein V7641_874, partial [Blastocatellia bacterium]